MEVIEVNHSIANRYNGYIEINKHLKKYPRLLNSILQHENTHTNDTFTWHDFKLDFLSNSNVNHLKLFKFMIKHPKSFLQLSPILYTRKGFIIDINLLIMYSIMFIVFISTICFGVKYL